jgi:hypothetical protein
MLVDNQLPRDIRDIKVQMAKLITQELEGVVRRAGEGLSLEEAGARHVSRNRATSPGRRPMTVAMQRSPPNPAVSH